MSLLLVPTSTTDSYEVIADIVPCKKIHIHSSTASRRKNILDRRIIT